MLGARGACSTVNTKEDTMSKKGRTRRFKLTLAQVRDKCLWRRVRRNARTYIQFKRNGRYVDWCYEAPSTVRNAGTGLFAARAFRGRSSNIKKDGALVVGYFGHLRINDHGQRGSTLNNSTQVMQAPIAGMVVVPRCTSGTLSGANMVNSVFGTKKRVNVTFHPATQRQATDAERQGLDGTEATGNNIPYFRCKHDMAVGDEMLTDYQWKDHEYVGSSKNEFEFAPGRGTADEPLPPEDEAMVAAECAAESARRCCRAAEVVVTSVVAKMCDKNRPSQPMYTSRIL